MKVEREEETRWSSRRGDRSAGTTMALLGDMRSSRGNREDSKGLVGSERQHSSGRDVLPSAS